jgi:hypothetical protein
MSIATPRGKSGKAWQYHGRSDLHSKVACWVVLYDLIVTCDLLAKHIANGEAFFGINHSMHDFKQNKPKKLDLVLCTAGTQTKKPGASFIQLAKEYDIQLDDGDRDVLGELPPLMAAPVGSVRCALEAKACMTEHGKAESRFYDELNSSHQVVHGASDSCIAAGFVLVNSAVDFCSPTRGTPTVHKQPKAAERVIARVRQLPRRTKMGENGFDALAVAVVDCSNDPGRAVRVVEDPPAPRPGDPFHYDQMIRRIASVYESRFPQT